MLEMMSKRFWRSVKSIFFPFFSEIELITLFYLLFLFSLDHHQVLFMLFGNFLLSIIHSENVVELFRGIFVLFMLVIGLGYLIKELIRHALQKQTVPMSEKGMYAYLYYILISSIAALSMLEATASSTSLVDQMNEASKQFVLFRSTITFLLVLIIGKLNLDRFYATQMTDEQLGRGSLVVLIVLSLSFYLMLRETNGMASTLSLSYFYTTTVLFLYKQTVNLLHPE